MILWGLFFCECLRGPGCCPRFQRRSGGGVLVDVSLRLAVMLTICRWNCVFKVQFCYMAAFARIVPA